MDFLYGSFHHHTEGSIPTDGQYAMKHAVYLSNLKCNLKGSCLVCPKDHLFDVVMLGQEKTKRDFLPASPGVMFTIHHQVSKKSRNIVSFSIFPSQLYFLGRKTLFVEHSDNCPCHHVSMHKQNETISLAF